MCRVLTLSLSFFSKDTTITVEMLSFLQYKAYVAKANDSVTRFRLQDIVFALSTLEGVTAEFNPTLATFGIYKTIEPGLTLTKATETNAVNLLVTDGVCESCQGFLQQWPVEVCLIQPEKASAFDVLMMGSGSQCSC